MEAEARGMRTPGTVAYNRVLGRDQGVSAPESLEGTQSILWSGFPVICFVDLICYISLVYVSSCILLFPDQRAHWSCSGIRPLGVPLLQPSSYPLGSQDCSPGLARLKEHEFFLKKADLLQVLQVFCYTSR